MEDRTKKVLAAAFFLLVIVISYIVTRPKEVEIGDTVLIDLTLEIEGYGIVLTTNKRIAEAAKILNPKWRYTPLSFVVGDGTVPSGVEEAILGMKVGEEKVVTLPPEKAFGYKSEDMIKVMSIAEFKNKFGFNPSEGQPIEEGGFGYSPTILKVTDKDVYIDFNHPFAANPALVSKIPIEELERQGITPKLYMEIDFGGKIGRIIKITDEYVYVDFNPWYTFKIKVLQIRKG